MIRISLTNKPVSKSSFSKFKSPVNPIKSLNQSNQGRQNSPIRKSFSISKSKGANVSMNERAQYDTKLNRNELK